MRGNGNRMSSEAHDAIARSRWKKVWEARPLKDELTLAVELATPMTVLVLPIKHWSVTRPDRFHYCLPCIGFASSETGSNFFQHLITAGMRRLQRVHLQEDTWATFSIKRDPHPNYECKHCSFRRNHHMLDFWAVEYNRQRRAAAANTLPDSAFVNLGPTP